MGTGKVDEPIPRLDGLVEKSVQVISDAMSGKNALGMNDTVARTL